MPQTYVGIDVSKHQLNVALWGRPEEDDRLANAPRAIEVLCWHWTRLAPDRIVVEATGGAVASPLTLIPQQSTAPFSVRTPHVC